PARPAARGGRSPALPRPAGERGRGGDEGHEGHRQVRLAPGARRPRPRPEGGLVTIEDRLRATTEAVTEAMRPVRPLDLTSSRAGDSAPVRPPSLLPRRWPGWLIPITAAVAVIGVAATLVAVRDLPGSHTAPRVTPAASATSTSTSTPPPSAVPVVPRYYVTLSAEGRIPVRDAIVADARTGKRIAVVKPPSNATFAGMAAAPDNRTFVLDAMTFWEG